MGVTATSPAARVPSSTRWPLLGALAWVAVVMGFGQVVFATLWRDDLADCSRGMLAVHLAAFMCQTFAYHAGIAMIPVMLLALASRRRRLLIGAAVVLVIGAGPEVWSVMPRRGMASRDSSTGIKMPAPPSIKIMSVNLMYGHGDDAALLAQIEREAPEVLCFQEWTPNGSERLAASLRAAYPHVLEAARADAFGQAVFSRVPFIGAARAYPPSPGFREPQIVVSVGLDGRALHITNVHLLPPVSLAYFAEQRGAARRLAEWQKSRLENRPDVLIGDFNATSRSGALAALRRAEMRDAQAEAGWWRGSTWPRTGWLAWMPGIRLDHALLGSLVECVGARTGEDFGSDHRPVIIVVKWKPYNG